jgi:hypothetical protein
VTRSLEAEIAREQGWPRAWAGRVIEDILQNASAGVRDKGAYVRTSIMNDPSRFQPVRNHPPVSEIFGGNRCDHGYLPAKCPFCRATDAAAGASA